MSERTKVTFSPTLRRRSSLKSWNTTPRRRRNAATSRRSHVHEVVAVDDDAAVVGQLGAVEQAEERALARTRKDR